MLSTLRGHYCFFWDTFKQVFVTINLLSEATELINWSLRVLDLKCELLLLAVEDWSCEGVEDRVHHQRLHTSGIEDWVQSMRLHITRIEATVHNQRLLKIRIVSSVHL